MSPPASCLPPTPLPGGSPTTAPGIRGKSLFCGRPKAIWPVRAHCIPSTHNMDPAIVGSAEFGQIWRAALPGNYRGFKEQIFSQPLVYTLDDGIQYVFIATTQNNLYKFNAKTGALVAQRNLHIPFLTADLDGCVDINPLIGVTVSQQPVDPARRANRNRHHRGPESSTHPQTLGISVPRHMRIRATCKRGNRMAASSSMQSTSIIWQKGPGFQRIWRVSSVATIPTECSTEAFTISGPVFSTPVNIFMSAMDPTVYSITSPDGSWGLIKRLAPSSNVL